MGVKVWKITLTWNDGDKEKKLAEGKVFAFLSEMNARVCFCLCVRAKGVPRFYGYMHVWAWAPYSRRNKRLFFFTQRKVNSVERCMMGFSRGSTVDSTSTNPETFRGLPRRVQGTQGGIPLHHTRPKTSAGKAAGRPPLSLAKSCRWPTGRNLPCWSDEASVNIRVCFSEADQRLQWEINSYMRPSPPLDCMGE